MRFYVVINIKLFIIDNKNIMISSLGFSTSLRLNMEQKTQALRMDLNFDILQTQFWNSV